MIVLVLFFDRMAQTNCRRVSFALNKISSKPNKVKKEPEYLSLRSGAAAVAAEIES